MGKNSHWDDSIKRALENLQAGDGNHWDGMEALLNNPANADLSEFAEDQVLRNKLNDVNTTMPIGHWDGMETLLNDPANADLSEFAEDQVLRNKLNDVDTTMPVGHWALMEAQLAGMETAPASEELEDVLLDGKAYESLNNLQTPYNAQHWPIMEEKLVDAFSWRKKAVRYKLMELAILLLTFVTVLQYWPEAKEMLPKLKKGIPSATPAKATTPQPIVSADIQTNESTTVQNNKINTTAISSESFQAKHSAFTNPSLATTTDVSDEELKESKLQSFAAALNAEKKQQAIHAENEINTADKIANMDFLASDQQNIEAIPTIPHLKFGPLATKELALSTKKIQLIKLLENTSFRMGMYGLSSLDALEAPQVDGNRISETEQISETQQATIGYGTGLSMAFKNGRWELESGIGYMSKSVRPNDPKSKELQVSLSRREVANTVWTETKYDMINIPVHVRYNVMDRTNWKMYLQSGLSMNINQNIIYRYDQVITGEGTEPGLLFPTGGAEDDRDKTFEASDVTKNVGTAEERLSSSNSFFNFDVGFGLERAINKRYATFVQSRYSHRLGEAGNIGLEGESIIFRSIQLKAGVKVSLFSNKKKK